MSALVSMLDEALDENDWEYLSEGRMHLVVASSKKDGQEVVLRIPTVIENADDIGSDGSTHDNLYSNDRQFVANVMAKWFHVSYIPPVIGKAE
jgi:hypothetical protein